MQKNWLRASNLEVIHKMNTPCNILGIGSHFDDIELGCSGTLIKHVLAGDKVTMLVITDSEYRNPAGELVRCGKTAKQEGMEAANTIGADLICLEYKTFEVPFNEALTCVINRYIDELNIDTVYSHWTGDLHRDHQLTARCALMAGRHVPRFLMYRSNYYDSDRPFRGNYYSDISDVMERKVQVIKSHHSELERVRYKWIEFFKHQNSADGLKIGCDYAETFEIVRYLR